MSALESYMSNCGEQHVHAQDTGINKALETIPYLVMDDLFRIAFCFSQMTDTVGELHWLHHVKVLYRV
jgi:hypothetical protein